MILMSSESKFILSTFFIGESIYCIKILKRELTWEKSNIDIFDLWLAEGDESVKYDS